MTKEELREHCEKQVRMCEEWARGNDREPSGKTYEEHKLVLDLIKASEQQPSEDCISRAEVQKFVSYIQSIKDSHNEEDTPINYGTICDLVIRGWKLVELPPITPTRKSGLHWIERFDNESMWLECPHCHRDSIAAYNYCPNCGAEMRGDDRC